MALAFDTSAGTTGLNTSGSGASETLALTAASGADVYLSIVLSFTLPPSSVQYGSTSLTLLGSQSSNNTGTGGTYLYRGIGLGTGSSQNFTFTIPTGNWFVAAAESWLGVGSVGTAVTAFGTGTAPSSGSVTCTTGQVIVCAVGAGFSAAPASNMSTPTGGTNRQLLNASTGSASGLALSDSTSTATFGATLGSGGNKWATVAVVLSPTSGLTPASASVVITRSTPSIGLTVNPAGAAISVTTSSPGVTVASANTYFPTSAPIAITTGTPDVSVPKFISPASATVSITGGTSATAMSYGPLARVINNLALGQSTTIQIIGDSTAFSAWDTGFSEATNPWTPGTLFGWAGRMAISLGNQYNANVQIRYWNYPSNSAYTSTTNLRTAVGRPTISVWLGAWPGGVMANYMASITAMLPVSNPDVVFIHDGFNELNASTFGTNLLSFIGSVQGTYCPGAPIIVNTENATTITNEGAGHPSFSSIFSALVNDLLSTHPALPLNPALQYSDSVSGVWVLDTQQAYDPAILASQLFTDGLHPVASGYAAQALWMLSELAPAVVTTLSPATATVTLTAGTPTVLNGITTVITPTGSSVMVTAGTPVTSLTGHVLTQPTGSLVTVTAGLAVVLGAGLHVSPAVARVVVSGGIPVVAIAFPAISTPPSRTLVAPTRYRTRGVLR